MSPQLSSYISLYGAAVSIVRPVIIVAILSGFWTALRRTDLMPARRTGAWLAVALPLVAMVRLHLECRRRGRIRSTSRCAAIPAGRHRASHHHRAAAVTRSQRIAAAIDAPRYPG